MVRRIFLLVLDGVGIGELPDAHLYGDAGSNTLVNTARAAGGLNLPVLSRLGLGNITEIKGVSPVKEAEGAYGKMAERSPGKDTITGHWEMTGVVLDRPFQVFPDGFPEELIKSFETAIGRRVLGNIPASGTEIIERLGAEHMHTGFPIVYTSADSVFQIAAHEEVIPPEELYRICRTARELLNEDYVVGRVIARPFVGSPGSFRRTANRRDFSMAPPEETILDRLLAEGVKTVGVGKIEDIFSGRGLAESFHTGNNRETMGKLLELASGEVTAELVFANCIDFDTLYGHRNDSAGYARALEAVDTTLEKLLSLLTVEDLLIITGDHGCDPTTASTDHSREYVPLLVTGGGVKKGVNLGTRETFADLSATLAEIYKITGWKKGKSFYKKICL